MSSRWAQRSLALLLVSMCSVSCGTSEFGQSGRDLREPGRGSEAHVQAPDTSGFYELISTAGSWRVVWRTEPSPIPLNEPFSVFVRVARVGTADFLPDIPIWVDAAMPHHQHGMNRIPEQVRVSPDLLRADGLLFHMPGVWTLSFDVTEGAITERAEVMIEVP
jgi:hypothetical protein